MNCEMSVSKDSSGTLCAERVEGTDLDTSLNNPQCLLWRPSSTCLQGQIVAVLREPLKLGHGKDMIRLFRLTASVFLGHLAGCPILAFSKVPF